MIICVIVKRREILHESAPHLVDKVYSYRGGYIAEVSFFLYSSIIQDV